jgi:hypothetical protein
MSQWHMQTESIAVVFICVCHEIPATREDVITTAQSSVLAA